MANYFCNDQGEVVNQLDLGLPPGSFIIGGAGPDVITLGAGTAQPKGGNNKIIGLSPYSNASYDYSPTGIVADMNLGTVANGFGGTDTLVNIATLMGSRFDDTVTGSSGDDTFWPSSGNDRFVGGGGIDVVTYKSATSPDLITYDPSSNTLTVRKPLADGSVGIDLLTDVDALVLEDERGEFRLVPEDFKPLVVPPSYGGSFAVQGIDWNDYGYGQYGDPRSQLQMSNFMKSIGANTISLNNHYQFDPASSRVLAVAPSATTAGTNPTQPGDIMAGVAAHFRAQGLQVHHRVYLETAGEWTLSAMTAQIQSGRFDATTFFRDYTAMLSHEASVAESMGASLFCIGVEMGLVTSRYADEWATAIAAVRQHFSGTVTYAANFNMGTAADRGTPGVYNYANEAPTLSFGHLLDVIGLDNYSGVPIDSLGNLVTGTPTVQQGLDALDNAGQLGYSVMQEIRRIADQFGKKIIFEEGGWLSVDLEDSPGGGNYGEVNQLAQANLWEASLQGYKTFLSDILIGYNGMGEFPANNLSVQYLERGGSIRGKLAEVVFTDWYTGLALDRDLTVRLTATTAKGFGQRGDDTFLSIAGRHSIDGGDGIDTVSYAGARATFLVESLSGGAFKVSGRSVLDTSTQHVDMLANVERLQFSDTALALDLGGHAGKVARIIGAVLGKSALSSPELVGIGLHLLDSGVSFRDLCAAALTFKLGPVPAPGAVVDLLYRNVVGALPSETDRAHWVRLLDEGSMAMADLASFAAETDLNSASIDLVGLTNLGIAYLPYHG